MANLNGPDRPVGNRPGDRPPRGTAAATGWWIAAIVILAIIVVWGWGWGWGWGGNNQAVNNTNGVNTAQNTVPPNNGIDNNGAAGVNGGVNNNGANGPNTGAPNNAAGANGNGIDNNAGNPANAPANNPGGATP